MALVSKFFRALFSHQFEDSHKPVLHLDAGGEMGLTVAAVKVFCVRVIEIIQNITDFSGFCTYPSI